MKAMLLLLAAVTAQPLYAAAPADQGPQPVDRPSTWIADTDYPAAALADRPEGTVAFSLNVNAAGNVTGCLVRASSGFAVLDSATCTVLTQRAKFKPASSRSGNWTFNGRVRWLAPEPAGSMGPMTASLSHDDEDIMAFARSH